MTPEEHDHVQELEGLVKRYRSRIVELKAVVDYWHGLLVDADSMLSAAGHGRVVTKAEMLELSGRLRSAYTAALAGAKKQERG